MKQLEEYCLEPGLHRFQVECDGYLRYFRLYMPENLPEGKHPLLMVLHGGDHAMSHVRTSWHILAQEKHFLVVYPESIRDGWMWNSWDNLGAEQGRPDDVAYLDFLIRWLPQRLPVDPSRIYLNGQSMGDMMGMHYAYIHPDHIAAAFLTSGPTKTKWWMAPGGVPRFTPAGECPVMRLHGEMDVFRASCLSPTEAKLFKQQCHVEQNSIPWRQINRCEAIPAISTTEEFALLCYAGENCDYWEMFTKNGVHRPPEFTERFCWEYFFSGWTLEKGKHVRREPEKKPGPDTRAIAAAAGSRILLLDGVLKEAPGEAPVSRDNELYVPAGTLGLDWEPLEDGTIPLTAALQKAGYHARFLFDAVYAAPQHFGLSFDLAYNIRSLLGVQPPLSPADAWQLEDRIYRCQTSDAGFPAPKDREEEIWQWGHTV